MGAYLVDLLTDTTRSEECIVEVPMKNGHRMQIDLRSRTEKWAFVSGSYDQDVIDYMVARLNHPGATILDVGANVGFYSIPLGLRLQKNGGQLHAFEPVPTNLNSLTRNVELNDLSGVVVPHQMALGDTNGQVELSLETDNNSETGNAVMLTGKTGTVIRANTTAPIRRLDDCAASLGITSCSLIKVDIEGGEYDFLKGSLHLIDRSRPVIFGEFNPYWMRMQGYFFEDVMRLLAPFGYRVFSLTNSGSLLPVSDVKSDIHDIFLISS